MDDAPRRAFTIRDGAILLGATALAVAWIREFAVNALASPPGAAAGEIWRFGAALAFVGLPFVLLWSIALVAIRLTGPRPRRRRLAGAPGIAACTAVTLGTILGALVLLPVPLLVAMSQGARDGSEPLALSLAEALALIAPLLGLVVALTWAALAVRRRWSPSGCWLDRAGLGLGVAWLMMIPLMGSFWLVALLG